MPADTLSAGGSSDQRLLADTCSFAVGWKDSDAYPETASMQTMPTYGFDVRSHEELHDGSRL